MGEGRKVKLSERTADRLCELIMDERQFTPGSKLPNENELSEALHVSRTTLREPSPFWWPRACWRSAGARARLSRRICPPARWI